MHLLLAAFLEAIQTHSETVNAKKVMYILVRAGILQT